jgi:ABC-type nitrate/sulfonate/bicarbonate transport system substrate-binding protein
MPHTRSIWPALALVSILAVMLAACGDDDSAPAGGTTTATGAASATPAGPPDKITFMAGFKPQANLPFVGAYVAKEKGFFADENLDVDIKHSTPGDNFRFLATGQVQFSTADASALLEKRTSDPPLPFVSIALIGQKGQQGFAVMADSGINSPQDWAGKTAGYKGSAATPDYLAILEANGVDRSKVHEVKVGFEPQVLTEGKVDIFPVFVANEPDTLKRLGYDTKVFQAADYGAPTIGLTYITTEDYIKQHPDTVRRFLKATLRGIRYADDHRDEAIQIVMKYAPQEQREHQRYMLDTELEAAHAGEGQTHAIGWQTQDQWQKLHDFLVKYNGLPHAINDISAVFTDRFLKEISAGGASP